MMKSLMVLVRDEEGNLLARRSDMNGTLWKLENDTFFNVEPIEIGPAEREGKPVTLHCVSHSGRVFIGGPLSIAGRVNITRLMVGYKLLIPTGMVRIQWHQGEEVSGIR